VTDIVLPPMCPLAIPHLLFSTTESPATWAWVLLIIKLAASCPDFMQRKDKNRDYLSGCQGSLKLCWGVAVAEYSPINCIWHSFGTLVNLDWVATSVASEGESACPNCATCGAADDAERTEC